MTDFPADFLAPALRCCMRASRASPPSEDARPLARIYRVCQIRASALRCARGRAAEDGVTTPIPHILNYASHPAEACVRTSLASPFLSLLLILSHAKDSKPKGESSTTLKFRDLFLPARISLHNDLSCLFRCAIIAPV